jgi:TonB family protein
MRNLFILFLLTRTLSVCFAQEDNAVHEKGATYVGGEKEMVKFIRTNVHYKKIAQEGIAYISFTVLTDGALSGIKLLKSSSCTPCDEEALRVVSIMPKWDPAFINGKNVPVEFVLPIKFGRLSGSEKKISEQITLHSSKAAEYIQKEMHTEAIEELTEVLKLNPMDIASLLKRAEEYLKVGNKTEGCEDYQSIRKIHKDLLDRDVFKERISMMCN